METRGRGSRMGTAMNRDAAHLIFSIHFHIQRALTMGRHLIETHDDGSVSFLWMPDRDAGHADGFRLSMEALTVMLHAANQLDVECAAMEQAQMIVSRYRAKVAAERRQGMTPPGTREGAGEGAI